MAKDDFIGATSKAAGGWGALKSCGKQLLGSGAPLAGMKAMLQANQPDGFDCPGCAWGDPEHGSSFEFCENGVKAVAWEATKRRATPEFFAAHAVSALRGWSDHDLEQQGRLTHPMRHDPATDTYVPVTWDEAFAGIGAALRAIPPDTAEFYTSGRASNEAAFLYQTFVRLYGTNNFPDCSNMCHEASGVALTDAIGIGKGTVRLEDFELADAIFVIGQNPGTNHPRMLADLRRAAARGARIVVFNPLKEKGLQRFADPQNKLEMMRGGSEPTSTDYFQPRLGGDMAAVRGMAKVVLAEGTLDRAFIEAECHGFDDWRAVVEATGWPEIEDQSGLSRAEIERAARIYMNAERVICTWAMGVTQHRHSVATIREIANFMFLRGNIGRPGAGLCPVRGHSNVQGDRTVGINEKAPEAFIAAMEAELGVTLPRRPGHNVLAAMGAMLDGSAKAFVGLGGNFARATPDSALLAEAMPRLDLTVHVATKLNHSHLLPGRSGWLLPCLGRTEIDRNAAGIRQIVTVEDSMSMVHGSGGINLPASEHLKSEIAIVAGIAEATVGTGVLDWAALAEDHDEIRAMIARVLPSFDDYNTRVRQPRGFWLRNPASEREWRTPTGRANFGADPLPHRTEWQEAQAGQGAFVLQTFRSHDQYNTTIYGMDDRYRGVYGERRVVFMHPEDLRAMGRAAGDRVDVLGTGGRVAEGFRLVPYDIPRGCVAGYYPELNVLVPHDAFGDRSHTPVSKSIPVRFRPAS
ncbi:FdhF/YdeP family oxidoreductase [Falsirhodobacter algicola]|uniref:FdhF/YdeP family oxidoreductase n=1 Tax=Falsirhodobacter algicola TaxID=2692330 RepID=A0A8J8MUX2_9RHOB|nr:FdhF/YdeP family oxidoreductase [Falsirhodobacter algicola]QUS36999.1 FdhF/YdeP family oxidoreductase [Falsirhodobacter algicola]